MSVARQGLSLSDMKDLKATLMGKTLRDDGTVDHTSKALTPHLKLFVVTYQEQIQDFKDQALVQQKCAVHSPLLTV